MQRDRDGHRETWTAIDGQTSIQGIETDIKGQRRIQNDKDGHRVTEKDTERDGDEYKGTKIIQRGTGE